MQTVGLGSFGGVVLCRYKKNDKVYIMKILKKMEIIKQKQVNHVYSEFHILLVINYPFIVQLVGFNFDDPKYLYFIIEYVQGR